MHRMELRPKQELVTEHDRIVFIQKPFGKDTLVQTVEKLFAE